MKVDGTNIKLNRLSDGLSDWSLELLTVHFRSFGPSALDQTHNKLSFGPFGFE